MTSSYAGVAGTTNSILTETNTHNVATHNATSYEETSTSRILSSNSNTAKIVAGIVVPTVAILAIAGGIFYRRIKLRREATLDKVQIHSYTYNRGEEHITQNPAFDANEGGCNDNRKMLLDCNSDIHNSLREMKNRLRITANTGRNKFLLEKLLIIGKNLSTYYTILVKIRRDVVSTSQKIRDLKEFLNLINFCNLELEAVREYAENSRNSSLSYSVKEMSNKLREAKKFTERELRNLSSGSELNRVSYTTRRVDDNRATSREESTPSARTHQSVSLDLIDSNSRSIRESYNF